MVNDTKLRSKLAGAVKMQYGIYEEGRFFSPYYNQASFSALMLQDKLESSKYFQIAYQDVREAFLYYMEHVFWTLMAI